MTRRLPFLGRIPIDPALAACEDAGKNFFVEHSESDTLEALGSLAKQMIDSATADALQKTTASER